VHAQLNEHCRFISKPSRVLLDNNVASLSSLLQFNGAMASSALEMAGMDRYMQLQQDQVPFKVRAKRGCATHPRSIAERVRIYTYAQTQHNDHAWIDDYSSDMIARSLFMVVAQERRTRISEKLRKLQELVPNMDKVRNRLACVQHA
jgi:hypothetical protein